MLIPLIKMKKAQIWVETVIYILIGLSVIGILLAIITPKINEMKDKAVIDSMINGLDELDETINEVKLASGAKRIVEVSLKKGDLVINSLDNIIVFVLDNSKVEYSELNKTIERGNIIILTEKTKGVINVSLGLSYPGLNITYNENDVLKRLNKASLPYQLAIENKGENTVYEGTPDEGKITQIDISPIS